MGSACAPGPGEFSLSSKAILKSRLQERVYTQVCVLTRGMRFSRKVSHAHHLCSFAGFVQSTVSFTLSSSRTSSKGSAEHGVSRSRIKTPQPREQNCCPAGLANRAETCCGKLRKVLFPVHPITDFTSVLHSAATPAVFSTVSLVHACNVPTQTDELL